MYSAVMEQKYSSPVNWVGEEHLGFVINASFSLDNASKLNIWLQGLNDLVSEGIYAMTSEGLHITVLDWVAPLSDYDGADKRNLFEKLYPSYDMAFKSILDTIDPFNIEFSELRVTPGAIILVGHDNGQFQTLRNTFMEKITLPVGGKHPPAIIHSTLARFIAPEIQLSIIDDYASSHPLSLTQHVEEFRLVETRREPMQDFDVIQRYHLE